MSRYRGPVTRLSRKLGIALFTNGESKSKAYSKKKYKPGDHGQKRFAQISEYKKHLEEKQKAKILYGISEKHCRKYYEMACKTNEMTGVQFMKYLEQRMDNVIFRAGFASTRAQGRQMVCHGLVKLNGKRITIPSILIKLGDVFEIREKNKGSRLFEGAAKSKFRPPKWLKIDIKALKGEVIALPDKDDIEKAIDSQLITEYYSK